MLKILLLNKQSFLVFQSIPSVPPKKSFIPSTHFSHTQQIKPLIFSYPPQILQRLFHLAKKANLTHHSPNRSIPYTLDSKISHHRSSFSSMSSHLHFPNKEALNLKNVFNSQPPEDFGLQILSQLTQHVFLLSPYYPKENPFVI